MPSIEDELEYAIARLTSKELEVLLRWKGVPVPKMGSVVNRRVLYQQFADKGEEEEASIDAAESEAFLWRLTEINATQSPPSNLTPV